MSWLTWQQVMNEEPLTPCRRVLIQAIASLTTHPQFKTLTPEETYLKVLSWAKEIAAEEAARVGASG